MAVFFQIRDNRPGKSGQCDAKLAAGLSKSDGIGPRFAIEAGRSRTCPEIENGGFPMTKPRIRALDRFRLDGLVALVTGAGRGLGEACAIALADAGAEVNTQQPDAERTRRSENAYRKGRWNSQDRRL